ncbi:hypothetical protein [Streptomyces sp. NPDC127103]|uniref:hypothetical protein n=1 Tax=Streptomyces sp. NPDC127103 TaxID=3347139 RepID=UPI0036489EBD
MSETTDRALEAFKQQPDSAGPEVVRAYWRDVTLGEEQADRLGWSIEQAGAVAHAAAGALVLDQDGTARHVTGTGPGRRVAAGRIAALRAAGFLAETALDATGRRRIEPTTDGRRALMVWQRWSPAPVVKDKRAEREALAPLYQGDEARRRAVAAARRMQEWKRQREADWAETEARIAAGRREDELNAQWREANGIRNPWAKRPAGWTVEAQAEADRAAAQEAAEAAAREAAHVCEVREPEPATAPAVQQRRTEHAQEPAGAADPFRYRYTVAGPQRADRYTGPLAEAEGRMRIHGGTALLTVRTHDAGRHGTLRREAAEHLAEGYGVKARRTAADPVTGRVPRHALDIEGDPLKVARFAADLPALLAAVEATATTGVRQLARWRTHTDTGQRWSQRHSPAQWRSHRRHWRRICIRHLARWVGPAHDGSRPEPGMPHVADDWTQWAPRVAQTLAHTIDPETLRDHMAEALVFAQAVRTDEAEQFTGAAELTATEQDRTTGTPAAAELTATTTAAQATGSPTTSRVPHRPGSSARIVRRPRPYGSIGTRARARRPAPVTPPSRTPRRTTGTAEHRARPALEKEGTRA